MKIEFQPIVNVGDAAAWVPLIETMTLFDGQCTISDLEWDEDELRQSLIERTSDRELRADYQAEPQFAIDEAKNEFISELVELLDERAAVLKEHSPFIRSTSATTFLVRKQASDTSDAGLAYAWLVFFWTINSPPELVVVDKEEVKAFGRLFDDVFEVIAAMVMAARSPSLVWRLGDSRDVREFLTRLSAITTRTGSGVVKSYSQLKANQIGANDAGVDVIAIEVRSGNAQRDLPAYLVGVTIQKSDRRKKIVGMDEVRRFVSYFLNTPRIVYYGVLAIPFVGTDLEHENCSEKQCLYITKPEVLQYLGRYPTDRRGQLTTARARHWMRDLSRRKQSEASFVSSRGETQLAWA